jgi:hypothetical protein
MTKRTSNRQDAQSINTKNVHSYGNDVNTMSAGTRMFKHHDGFRGSFCNNNNNKIEIFTNPQASKTARTTNQ